MAKDIPITVCACGAKFRIANYFNRDVGDKLPQCPNCKKEVDFHKTVFVDTKNGIPCNKFELDLSICDDCYEPKGQCSNCGYDEEEHLIYARNDREPDTYNDEFKCEQCLKICDIEDSIKTNEQLLCTECYARNTHT